MNKYISQTLNLSEQAVANTLKLLSEGATIPFISRYRKEATGGLDEVQIAAIDTAHKKLVELDKLLYMYVLYYFYILHIKSLIQE